MDKMIVSVVTKGTIHFYFYEPAKVREDGLVIGQDIHFWAGAVYEQTCNRGVDYNEVLGGFDFGGGDIIDPISWEELMAMPKDTQIARVKAIGDKVYTRLKALLKAEEQAKVKDAKAKEAFKEMVI